METLQKRERAQKPSEAGPKDEAEQAQLRGSFARFRISEASARNLRNKGIEYLFPIQYATFDHIYEGKDLIGRDRTGSGKTLAFALPILERLRAQSGCLAGRRGQRPLLLCLVPTRELAMQVAGEFIRFRNSEQEYRVLAAYGGTLVSDQRYSLREGAEIVVGTPGRVLDLIERQDLQLTALRHFILDETDQMLDMGFQEDIERVLRKVRAAFEQCGRSFEEIQCLLFSATVPPWVKTVALRFMKSDAAFIDMVRHSEAKTPRTVEHLSVCVPSKEIGVASLWDLVSVYAGGNSRTIIFTDRKEEANEVGRQGKARMDCQVLHGDIPQDQREMTFKAFREGSVRCLVATNVAARGLDIPKVDLIVQLSPPIDGNSYIHRAGRTGRAGKTGICITLYKRMQQGLLERIEEKAGIRFRKIELPKPGEVAQAAARDVDLMFDGVTSEALSKCGETAQNMLAKYSPDEALRRALALLLVSAPRTEHRPPQSSPEQPTSHRMQGSHEQSTSYQIELDQEATSTAFFWSLLRKHFPPAVVEAVTSLRMQADRRTAVFELKSEHCQTVEETAQSLRTQNVFITRTKYSPGPQAVANGHTYQKPNGYKKNTENGFKKNFENGYKKNVENGYKKNFETGFKKNFETGFKKNFETGFKKNTENVRPLNDHQAKNGEAANCVKDETKLFVANLDYEYTEVELGQLVKAKGFQPLGIFLARNPDKTSKGFAYVQFADKAIARAAWDELAKTKINGRQLRLNFADKKTK